MLPDVVTVEAVETVMVHCSTAAAAVEDLGSVEEAHEAIELVVDHVDRDQD